MDWQVKLFEIRPPSPSRWTLTAPAQKENQSGIQYGSSASEQTKSTATRRHWHK